MVGSCRHRASAASSFFPSPHVPSPPFNSESYFNSTYFPFSASPLFLLLCRLPPDFPSLHFGHLAVDANYNFNYTCANCRENTVATPRERIIITITDVIGSLDVTVFGDQAVSIVQMNSIACMEMFNEVKRKERTFRGAAQLQYIVLAVEPTQNKELLISTSDPNSSHISDASMTYNTGSSSSNRPL